MLEWKIENLSIEAEISFEYFTFPANEILFLILMNNQMNKRVVNTSAVGKTFKANFSFWIIGAQNGSRFKL